MEKAEIKILIDKLIKAYKKLELAETAEIEGVVLTDGQKSQLTAEADVLYKEVKPDAIKDL